MIQSWREALLPPPDLTVSEWADRHRKLSLESSAEPGQWLTSRAEYQRGIMDAYNDPAIKEIVVMKSSQVGWTEILNNIIGYIIHQNPGPIMLLQPTEQMAEAWSKDRLSPMIRDTPVLLAKIGDEKSRNSGNTILHKKFLGGHLTVIGTNSPANLASRPIRDVLGDEIDRYPASAGSEGDPLNLAKKRTSNFPHAAKILLGGTPTVKGYSRIEKAFDESDKRYFNVPCKHCDERLIFRWSQVAWQEGKPESAYYVCEHCGSALQEAERQWMTRHGIWVPTAEFKGIAGFHISELYSPWSSLGKIAEDFLRAKKNPETLKVWVNTTLGESWEESGEKADPNALLSRREDYSTPIPNGVLVLTAGVDVQGNRLECEVVGWGVDDENWSIDYRVFYGDPALKDVWDDLDAYLSQTWEHAGGFHLKIAAACIDTGGHHTQQVYSFTKARQSRRIYAIRGSSTHGSPAVGRPSKKNKAGALLFPLGTDTIKEQIHSYLRVSEPGPAYCHFSIHHNDDEYFKQLTVESVHTQYHKGHAIRVWKKPDGARNEALDCRVYAIGAKELLNPNYAALAKRYVAVQKTELDIAPETAVSTESEIEKALVSKQQNKRPSRRQNGSYINRWRH